MSDAFRHEEMDAPATDAELSGLENIDLEHGAYLDAIASGESDSISLESAIDADDAEREGEHEGEHGATEGDGGNDDDHQGSLNHGEQEDGHREEPDEAQIPSYRVSEVMRQIDEMAETLGMDRPDFGEPTRLPQSDFNELVSAKNRLKVRFEASKVAADDNDQEQSDQDGEPVDQDGNTLSSDALQDLYRQRNEAFFDGEMDLHASLEQKIDAEKTRLITETVERRLDEQRAEAQKREDAQQKLNRVASEAVKRFPVLSENNYDNKYAKFVQKQQELLIKVGMPVHEALAEAVSQFSTLYGEQAQGEAEAPPEQKKSREQDDRKAKALARNARENMQQPPTLEDGIGNRNTPPVPKIETQEDWDRLSEKDREKLLMGM